ncbi:MAG: TenA family protein [Planctomycetes bacterium]|nr:TenA family protein [Planctomycetota bacterium]
MKWSEQAWQAAKPVYQRILELDFVKELMAGTLSRETFLFYIRQDSLYLVGFGKALAGIAAKLDHTEHSQSFLAFASECMAMERALHKSYLAGEDLRERPEPSPTCLLYTSYILKQLYDAPLEVAMAAVLPCFWVYKETGDHILAGQNRNGNPYQAWIDAYGGDEFAETVNKAIAICDEAAAACTEARRQAMTEAYVLCTKMEWMFWDSAWKREAWPVS